MNMGTRATGRSGPFRQVLWRLAAVVVVLIGARGARGAEHKPNVVLILADDLGYGDVGCFGQKRIKTPNLDRLAAQGVRFPQFYAGCTVCTPSRCVLMTGLHSGHCAERGNGDEGNPINEPTVAQVLKKAGYDTAAMGKWGIGEPGSVNVPGRKGFDSSGATTRR